MRIETIIVLIGLITLTACVTDTLPATPTPSGAQADVVYGDGSWTYIIEANVPTPCHGLEADVAVAESYPEQISIVVSVREPMSNEICPQVVDRTSIEGSAGASEYASMRITFEGETIYEHEARTPITDPVACPTVYDPVCGQPPMPPCPEGFGCIDVMPQPRTYSNECEMERDGATLIHEGECADTTMTI